MNTDEDKESTPREEMGVPKNYSNRAGTTDSGKDYEIKIAALLLLRCVTQKKTKCAWLAMNVNQCGAFDDVILCRETSDGNRVIYLIQLKHEDKGSNIKSEELKSKKKSPFYLQKYFESIEEIKDAVAVDQSVMVNQTDEMADYLQRNFHTVSFVLFTNRGTTDGCDFLKRVFEKSDTDMAWKLYETININGSVFELDYEKLDVKYEPSLKCFMERFFLFTKQPHVQKLDTTVATSIKSFIQPVKLPRKLLSDVSLRLLNFVLNWSKGTLGGYYPLTKTHISKRLLELLLEQFMVKLDESECVSFGQKNTWNRIVENATVTIVNESDLVVEEFLNGYFCNVVDEFTKNQNNLTLWRNNPNAIIQEILTPLSSNKTISFSDAYQYMWKTKKIPLLLKVDNSEENQQVQKILKLCQGLFKFIILNKSGKSLKTVSGLTSFGTVADLDNDCQEIILQHPVAIQGRLSSSSPVRLLNLVDKNMLKYISVKDIIYILSDKFSIGNNLEALPDFFEEISLRPILFDMSILHSAKEETFAIKCNDLAQFMLCFKNYASESSDDKDLNITVTQSINSDTDGRWIIFEDARCFKQVEDYYATNATESNNVHLLIFHAPEHLEWIKSFGTVKTIREFTKQLQPDVISNSVENVISTLVNHRKSICISSDPGMGKSVLLNHIALNLTPNFWALKVNLPEYKDIFKMWKSNTSFKEAIDKFVDYTLNKHKCDSILVRHIFQKYFDSKNVIFLLDAFDEVPVSYQKAAQNMIKSIHDSNYLMCLTTRPVLKIELETMLDTFSISLNLFTKRNQVNYLQNYFGEKLNTSSSDELLESFIDKLLDATKKNLNDRDNNFVGVPLQTNLLAEVFQDDCQEYLRTRHFKNKYFDLLFLYKHFIRQKVNIACNKVEGVSEDTIKQYKICRSFYALRLIFSRFYLSALNIDEKLKQATELFPLMTQLIQKDGIIVAESASDINFIHRTFAEYLAAKWLSKNLESEHKGTARSLISETFNPSLVVVRNIFDRILAKDCPLHLAVINRNVEDVKRFVNSDLYKVDNGKRFALHLISCWGLHHPNIADPLKESPISKKMAAEDAMMKILKQFPSNQLSNSAKDFVLNSTPLDYAVRSGSLNIANAICEDLKNPYYFTGLNMINKCKKSYLELLGYTGLARTYLKYCLVDDLETEIEHVSFCCSKVGSLHYAARYGHVEEVRRLTLDVENINEFNANGVAPLHVAVMFGHTEVVSVLLSQEANPNIADVIGRTPLHWASVVCGTKRSSLSVKEKPQELCSSNTENSASINDSNASNIVEDVTQENAINLNVAGKDIDIVRVLLAGGADIDAKLLFKYYTSLMLAAAHGRSEVIELLLSHGADIEARGARNYTALMFAAYNGHVDCAKLFLDSGVNIEARDDEGNTSLNMAAFHGHIAVINLLLARGADVNTYPSNGFTPLMCAATNDHVDVVDVLLSNGAEKEAKNQDGQTAFILAAFNGHREATDLLLSRGSNIEAKNKGNFTALSVAAYEGRVAVVELLLQSGADKETTNADGDTPLNLAAFHGHTDVVNQLLTHGSDKESKNGTGHTALLSAAVNNQVDTVKLLLSRGANKEGKTNDGNTSLMLAAFNGLTDVVSLLLNEGADKDVVNNNGSTALIMSAYNGHANVVKLLLSLGANTDVRGYSNNTALTLAAYGGHADVVSLLLSHGCDVEEKNGDGNTPLMLAALNGHMSVVKLLLLHGSDKASENNEGVTAFILALAKEHADIANFIYFYKQNEPTIAKESQ